MQTNILLFQTEFRLRDFPALFEAAKRGVPLVFLFVEDAVQRRLLGRSAKWWLRQSCKHLEQKLHLKGSQLVYRRGSIISVLNALKEELEIGELFCSESYDPLHTHRLKEAEKQTGIPFRTCPGNLLIKPWGISPKESSHYRVFSPFWRKCLDILDPPVPLNVPEWIPAKELKSEPITCDASMEGLNQYWKPGEESAQETFESLLQGKIENYDTLRDRVDLEATSKLSPHLRWGEISVREIWHTLHSRNLHRSPGGEAFLRELGFREFAYHLLYHFPHLDDQPYREEFAKFPWEGDETLLNRWQQGKTGYPCVDAGMRQLAESGWMHNRARMVTASFLTKDLLIDWRRGEQWFWDLLVDADPALNPFNWQWTAGCGVDAAPYFRIFNPITQEKRFDPHGDYVRRWVPELAGASTSGIHSLGNPSKNQYREEEINGYPPPIVDHAEARKRALELFDEI